MPEENIQIASLIYWNNTSEMERILKWIEKLKDAGHVRDAVTRDYNEDCGMPVFYIP